LTIVLLNTGGIRFDLLKGNFTLNDAKTVSPFPNAFMVLKDIAYGDAKIVLDWLNTGRFGYIMQVEECSCGHAWDERVRHSWRRSKQHVFSLEQRTPGYVTYDGIRHLISADIDFGVDGDDTLHTPFPHYDIPFYVQSTLVPHDIRDNDPVDLLFTNFSSWGVLLASYILLIAGYFNIEFFCAIWSHL
jgi:hypothetical protein